MRSLPLLALATCLCTAAQARAADSAAPVIKTDNSAGPLEVHGNEILVEAPRIRGQIEVPQQPVEVFTEEDITAYGADTIEDLIAAISPQTTSGRGRGDGRPIILVNGQRITNFREIHRIPPEAIRRMEVLPEEVALRFGYPADQRVVNIILKDQFSALTASGEYNRPTRGGYDNFELQGGLFKVAGPRRYNVTAKVDGTTMLTENERNLRQNPSDIPDVTSDPNPASYRSLAPSDHDFSLEGTMTQGLGEKGLAGSITASAGYTHTEKTAWSGLDTVRLSYDGASTLRALPDPLTTQVVSDEFDASFGYSRLLGNWQFNSTFDSSYVDTGTRVDRRRDLSGLQSAAAAGQLAIDGALPFVPGAGVDTATNQAFSATTLATLSGTPFQMPGGDANLTAKAGFDYDHTRSQDTRDALGVVSLQRGDLKTGLNLALPLTSKDFLGAVGAFTLNLSGGLDRLSDFGTLTNWSAGLTWSPTDTLTLQASYLVNDAAPTLAQLGAPTVVNYNVAAYDFTKGTSALVTTISGGNPDLVKERQRDIKLSAQWKLPVFERSNLIVEYFHNRSSNVTMAFPLLTPAIEAAFADRVTRNSAGDLIAIDQRAVTYDEVSSSRIRWGFNLGGRLGSSSHGARGGESTPMRPASAPSGGFQGEASPGGRSGFDPSRFEAIRKQLCTPDAQPDLSALPEGMRSRLMGADGKIDPQRLAQFRARACSVNGPTAATGSFDPQRFARIRQVICAAQPGVLDMSALPERLADRLRGPDGKVDQARLTQMRERICASGNDTSQGEAHSSPASDTPHERGPNQAAAGGPSRMGGRGHGGRWNLSVYHTWRFTDLVNVAPGVPVLNELSGDAITAGGVPRHTIEAEGGMFLNGYGLRLKAEWNAPARINGSGVPGSSDLRFGSTFDIGLRLFANLGQNQNLVERAPFFKNTRVSFNVQNLLDSRQKVTDQNGDVPIAYQAAFRDPQGRVIGVDLRKMF